MMNYVCFLTKTMNTRKCTNLTVVLRFEKTLFRNRFFYFCSVRGSTVRDFLREAKLDFFRFSKNLRKCCKGVQKWINSGPDFAKLFTSRAILSHAWLGVAWRGLAWFGRGRQVRSQTPTKLNDAARRQSTCGIESFLTWGLAGIEQNRVPN